jgi:RNA polymerase sigma-70 factor (ECF subfamily)
MATDVAQTVHPERVTRLLIDWGNGEQAALDEMLPLVYEDLRRLAAFYMSRERPGHTLQPTALVNEAYLRLVEQRKVDWKNRAQFLGLAAEMMRRILVNYARERVAAKRGGEGRKVSLSFAVDSVTQEEFDVLPLNEALEKLTIIDSRKSRIVDLKFFGGLTTEEIAEVLQISHATIEREWSFARAWLYNHVKGEVGP